jgi:hypothetical protein
LCIYNKYQSPTVPKDQFRIKSWIKEINLSWKVPNLNENIRKKTVQQTQTYKKIVMKKSKLNSEFIFTWNCTKELFEMSYRNQGIHKNYFKKRIEF